MRKRYDLSRAVRWWMLVASSRRAFCRRRWRTCWTHPRNVLPGSRKTAIARWLASCRTRRSAGVRPLAIVSLGSTDCRYWRRCGVPAYVYGCSPAGMGQPDESVRVDEFLHIVRTHALAAWRYLSEGR